MAVRRVKPRLPTDSSSPASPFDGNRSNMRKIIGFAETSVVKQRDQIMRHAEFVVETRARESQVDPASAFGAANGNVANANAIRSIPPTAIKDGGWFGGLRRRFAFRAPV